MKALEYTNSGKLVTKYVPPVCSITRCSDGIFNLGHTTNWCRYMSFDGELSIKDVEDFIQLPIINIIYL